MAQLKLNLDTIGELDGGAARMMIDAALRSAIADLDDRGKDLKPREVNIKITMMLLENSSPVVRAEASTKVPSFRTAETVGILRREGPRSVVHFQSLSPDDPHQRTIDEQIDDRQR